MIDLTRVNSYSVEELAQALRSGECTYQDYINAYLTWEKRPPLEKVVEEMELEKAAAQAEASAKAAIVEEEKKDWNNAEFFHTIESYLMYKDKWSAEDRVEYALHLMDADARIEYLIREKEYKRKQMMQGLLKDMRDNPWRYRQELMRILFNGNITDAMRRYIEEKESDEPYAEFILSGNKLKMSDLIEAGVVPDYITKTDILAPDYTMPATQIKDMGKLPNDRTDVYFFGVPRSGKSSVLSGIIYKLWRDGRAGYEPQMVNGRDASGGYYQGLIEAIDMKKPPQGTPRDTVSCMKINLRSADGYRQNPITIVELSGEAFKEMSDRFISPTDIWNELGASECIANNNKKLMFFVLDYSIISDKNPENQTSATKQIMSLETALNVFTHDGPDPSDPTKGCTMSKVDTVAVIMTKCDLMNVSSHKERLDLAEEYINVNFRNFMGSLMKCNKDNGINVANGYRPYILAFSLGKFYVGNTVIINEDDPANIIDFISTVTRGENIHGVWSRLFNFNLH